MLGAFERTLALRYLRGAAGTDRSFLRFVIVAAVGGVAVGTGALLVATMIVRGFAREIEAKIVGFGQHIEAESMDGLPILAADSLAGAVAALPGVVAVRPAVLDFALLRASGRASAVDGAVLWGMEASDQPFVSERTRGRFDFAEDASGRPGLVVGARLAERLGLDIGDRVTAFSTRGVGTDARMRPRVATFHVAGVFETGMGDFDDQFALTDRARVAALFDYPPGSATRLDVTLGDPDDADALAARINADIGAPLFARTIRDVYRGLFAWVDLQQRIIPLLMSILTIVAAFNIVGVLLMIVLEKAREIGTLLAVGASRRAIRRLFVLLGFLVGVAGSTLGALGALAFGVLQARFRFVPLPADAYFLDAAPVEIRLLDVALVVVASIVLCTLAAYLPARAAARLEPVRTIRLG